MSQMQSHITMTLLENAENFLREAVHYATMTTPRNWK